MENFSYTFSGNTFSGNTFIEIYCIKHLRNNDWLT